MLGHCRAVQVVECVGKCCMYQFKPWFLSVIMCWWSLHISYLQYGNVVSFDDDLLRGCIVVMWFLVFWIVCTLLQLSFCKMRVFFLVFKWLDMMKLFYLLVIRCLVVVVIRFCYFAGWCILLDSLLYFYIWTCYAVHMLVCICKFLIVCSPVIGFEKLCFVCWDICFLFATICLGFVKFVFFEVVLFYAYFFCVAFCC